MLNDITREKDLYTITTEKGQHTTYNCATGEMRGVSGRVLKNPNREIRALRSCLGSEEDKEVTDRLISLKFFDQRGRDLIKNFNGATLLKNWKNVLGYLREYHDKPYNGRAPIEYRQYCIDHIPMRHDLNKDLETALKSWCTHNTELLINIANDRKLTKLMNISYKKALEYVSIVSKYVDVYANDSSDERDYARWIAKDACEIYQLEQQHSNIVGYGATVRIYLSNLMQKIREEENKEASERFGAHQQSINLFYEDDDYKINIPTSYNDCQKIADYFHNCVATIEWDCHLKNENIDRYLVTIEDKKTKKDVVCVDIDTQTMRFVQYYGRFNNTAPDEVDSFGDKYQQYLLTLKENRL